jgi:hypothetical protein
MKTHSDRRINGFFRRRLPLGIFLDGGIVRGHAISSPLFAAKMPIDDRALGKPLLGLVVAKAGQRHSWARVRRDLVREFVEAGCGNANHANYAFHQMCCGRQSQATPLLATPAARALDSGHLPAGSAHSLPKWTERAIIPGYHAASFTQPFPVAAVVHFVRRPQPAQACGSN